MSADHNQPVPGEAHRQSPEPVRADLFRYLLRLGDTSLILAQRLGEWIGHAPALEEDLGLGNLALDLIGQALRENQAGIAQPQQISEQVRAHRLRALPMRLAGHGLVVVRAHRFFTSSGMT